MRSRTSAGREGNGWWPGSSSPTRAAGGRADEIRRGDVLPCRGLHRRLQPRLALPGRLLQRLALDLRIAVLQERLGERLPSDREQAALGIDLEERSGLLPAE